MHDMSLSMVIISFGPLLPHLHSTYPNRLLIYCVSPSKHFIKLLTLFCLYLSFFSCCSTSLHWLSLIPCRGLTKRVFNTLIVVSLTPSTRFEWEGQWAHESFIKNPPSFPFQSTNFFEHFPTLKHFHPIFQNSYIPYP